MPLAMLLIVYIGEFSDLDELCCSGSDGHVAASSATSLRCVSFGPFASSFAYLQCWAVACIYDFLGPLWPHRVFKNFLLWFSFQLPL